MERLASLAVPIPVMDAERGTVGSLFQEMVRQVDQREQRGVVLGRGLASGLGSPPPMGQGD
jgi:hypothetical protein